MATNYGISGTFELIVRRVIYHLLYQLMVDFKCKFSGRSTYVVWQETK